VIWERGYLIFFLKWKSIWMLSALAWMLSEWKSIWMFSTFAWMCSYPWMLSIWMFSDELSATPQQFLLHLHAQASKLTWQACTEICITQSWTVRPTMRKDLFFYHSYWMKYISLSIRENCRSGTVVLCVHLTISLSIRVQREPAPRKIFQWTLLSKDIAA